MPRAVWNGVELALSDDYEEVEGNIYFPAAAIRTEYFSPSETETYCSWKGVANYYDIEVNGEINKDAAWFYTKTRPAAKNIEGYVAFWNGVEVIA